MAEITTLEEDRHTAGKRKINLIWEFTQSTIALLITAATIIAVLFALVEGNILANAFFLVIGFYFGRTNHQRVGGVELGR
jgi:hypothetical protein